MKSRVSIKRKYTRATHRVSYLLLSFMLVLGLGPMGCEGPQGEQGPKGKQGEEGTANIIYSNWVDANWNYVDELDRK